MTELNKVSSDDSNNNICRYRSNGMGIGMRPKTCEPWHLAPWIAERDWYHRTRSPPTCVTTLNFIPLRQTLSAYVGGHKNLGALGRAFLGL